MMTNEFIEEWFWRIVATITIAAVVQWWSSADRTMPNIGHRMQEEWTARREEWSANQRASAPVEEIAAENPRSALLDRLEKESKSTVIIDDDIEDEVEETRLRQEATNLKPSAPAEELNVPTVVEEEEVAAATAAVAVVRSAPAAPPSNQPPPIKAKSGYHPGLGGFLRWYETEASLYRIYTVGRTDDVEVHPPFIPKSERGHVNLMLKVTNKYRRTISIYWVDYKGQEVHKGNMANGGVFHQTTWIGHPWIFREKDSGALLCHYIPYKVIPTTDELPTVDSDDPEVGIHQFSIVSIGQHPQEDEGLICFIQDPVFPTDIQTTQDAASWTFHEMSRMNYMHINTVAKYFTNIVLHPGEAKYRQIRIAHKRFFEQVWATSARGLFLAAGFVEEGAYVELGSAEPLKRERVQDVSTLLFYMEKWKRIQGRQQKEVQPTGADGYGRAGFGRMGMNTAS